MEINIQRFENNIRDNAEYITEHGGTIKDYYEANLEQDERDVSCYSLKTQDFIDALDGYNGGDQEERDDQIVYINNCDMKIIDLLDNYNITIEEFLNR